MKSTLTTTFAVLFLSTMSIAQSLETERLVFAWTNMKKMVVESAKAMPEEHFAFSPTEEVRSFQDQLKHIATSNRFFLGVLVGEDNKAANQKTLQEVTGKDGIIADLEQSFDYVIATLPKITGFEDPVSFYGQNLTKTELLMQTEHHLHREHGKITIYMRMNGIAPAKSTSWLL